MARKKFREYNLDQQYLVPPDIRDWVGEGHFSRYISDFVSVLNLSKFEEIHKPGAGQPPYDPAMMLKIILYCSCRGVHSSRQWEQATYNDLGVRFLAANQHPDYSSFWKFKKRHEAAIQDLFVQVVACAKQMGIVKLGDIALDGTLLKANASRSRNVLGTEIDAIIAEGEALYEQMAAKWAQADAEDRAKNDDVPEKLKDAKNRLKALKEAKAVADQRMAEHHQKALELFEVQEQERQARHAEACPEQDPEGVDLRELREHRELSQQALANLVGIAQARLSQLESGHRAPSDAEREALENALGSGIRFKKSSNSLRSRKPPEKQVQNFINYTDPDSAVISRLGKTTIQGYNAQAAVDVDSHFILGLLVSRDTTDRHNLEPMLTELERTGCENFQRMLADSGYYSLKNLLALAEREIEAFIPPERKMKKNLAKACPSTQAMREKMASDAGKTARKRRSTSVEPVFGHIKGPMNFTRFLSRGLENVTTEWSVVATAHNLLKMLKKWK
jgi:transposase/transcriptional regulator with XRE-family HTH domain